MIAVIYSRKALAAWCVAAILLGSGLHFLHDLWPNFLTALIAPVNESLWEHVKLLIWPYLAAAVILTWGRPGGLRPWLLSLVVMTAVMLAVAYVYHIILGCDALWFDLILYALVMILGFWLPTRFSGPFDGTLWTAAAVAGVALVVLSFWFTFHPPETRLFADLSQKPEASASTSQGSLV